MEPISAAREASPLVAPFRTHCASCHDTTLPHPPNFLHGSPAEVEAKLDQCAPRMFVRLSMAGCRKQHAASADAARGCARQPRHRSAHWAASPELDVLKRLVTNRCAVRTRATC